MRAPPTHLSQPKNKRPVRDSALHSHNSSSDHRHSRAESSEDSPEPFYHSPISLEIPYGHVVTPKHELTMSNPLAQDHDLWRESGVALDRPTGEFDLNWSQSVDEHLLDVSHNRDMNGTSASSNTNPTINSNPDPQRNSNLMAASQSLPSIRLSDPRIPSRPAATLVQPTGQRFSSNTAAQTSTDSYNISSFNPTAPGFGASGWTSGQPSTSRSLDEGRNLLGQSHRLHALPPSFDDASLTLPGPLQSQPHHTSATLPEGLPSMEGYESSAPFDTRGMTTFEPPPSSPDPSGILGGANVQGGPDRERKRIMQACEPCRLRKAKCNGREPCSRCIQKSLDCVYAVERKMRGPNRFKKPPKPKEQRQSKKKKNLQEQGTMLSQSAELSQMRFRDFGQQPVVGPSGLSSSQSGSARSEFPSASTYRYGFDSSPVGNAGYSNFPTAGNSGCANYPYMAGQNPSSSSSQNWPAPPKNPSLRPGPHLPFTGLRQIPADSDSQFTPSSSFNPENPTTTGAAPSSQFAMQEPFSGSSSTDRLRSSSSTAFFPSFSSRNLAPSRTVTGISPALQQTVSPVTTATNMLYQPGSSLSADYTGMAPETTTNPYGAGQRLGTGPAIVSPAFSSNTGGRYSGIPPSNQFNAIQQSLNLPSTSAAPGRSPYPVPGSLQSIHEQSYGRMAPLQTNLSGSGSGPSSAATDHPRYSQYNDIGDAPPPGISGSAQPNVSGYSFGNATTGENPSGSGRYGAAPQQQPPGYPGGYNSMSSAGRNLEDAGGWNARNSYP